MINNSHCASLACLVVKVDYFTSQLYSIGIFFLFVKYLCHCAISNVCWLFHSHRVVRYINILSSFHVYLTSKDTYMHVWFFAIDEDEMRCASLNCNWFNVSLIQRSSSISPLFTLLSLSSLTLLSSLSSLHSLILFLFIFLLLSIFGCVFAELNKKFIDNT
jgi:hypothetical protein